MNPDISVSAQNPPGDQYSGDTSWHENACIRVVIGEPIENNMRNDNEWLISIEYEAI